MGLLTTRVGVPTTFQALGQTWKAGKQGRRVWREWTLWAKDFLPDPLQVAHKHVNWLIIQEQETIADKALAEDAKQKKVQACQIEQQRVTALALEQSTGWLAFNSPRVQSLLFSPDGMSYMLFIQLKDNHPGLDEDDAYAIFEDMGVEAVQSIFNKTKGEAPANPEKNGSAPAA